jgi:hypothetical protein
MPALRPGELVFSGVISFGGGLVPKKNPSGWGLGLVSRNIGGVWILLASWFLT